MSAYIRLSYHGQTTAFVDGYSASDKRKNCVPSLKQERYQCLRDTELKYGTEVSSAKEGCQVGTKMYLQTSLDLKLYNNLLPRFVVVLSR